MSGLEVQRTAQTKLVVQTTSMRNHLTVDTLLWFAREAQKAVDLGMPLDTRVDVTAGRLHARHVIVQEIP